MSIVSNGWTNVKGKPLISVLVVSISGEIFLSAYDYSEKFKMLILGNIRCALAPKFCGGARTHEISKTQKSFREISP